MKKYLSKTVALLRVKTIILFILLLSTLSIIISYIITENNVKATLSVMNAMGTSSSKTHMLYCESKFNTVVLIRVVIDFDNRTIMAYGRHHKMFVHPKTNLPYFVANYFDNIILTNAYANENGVPSIIQFIFNNQSNKYTIESLNAITSERQWKHNVICKY